MSKYGAFSVLYFPAFGLNTERHTVSLCIQSKCGKIRTRKNYVFGHFSRSVKLWWVGARERKKMAFFVPFILSKRSFFKICVLSQCIVYRTQFQNNFFYISKNITSYNFAACFLKSSKTFSVSLNELKNYSVWTCFSTIFDCNHSYFYSRILTLKTQFTFVEEPQCKYKLLWAFTVSSCQQQKCFYLCQYSLG